MEKALLPFGDEYDKKCGEIFLTKNGNVVFHCTLCEDKFPGFHNYFEHVYKQHYTPISEKRKSTAHLHELMGFSVKPVQKEPTIKNVEKPKEIVIVDEKITKNDAEMVNEMDFDDEELSSAAFEHVETSDEDESSDEAEVDPDYKKTNIKKKNTSRAQSKKTQEDEQEIQECPNCPYKTKHKRHMRDHIKRHLGVKDHQCTFCDKAFFNKSELTSHTRTHTGEKPYLCTDCGKGFSKSSELLEHFKRHRNIRDKECDICNMKFFNSKELRNHQAVHSDARPFACSMCEKAFKTRLSLKTHMKIHANKREYQCNFCNATFNQGSGLYAHINNKHSTLPMPTTTTTTKVVETQNMELPRNFGWF